MAKPTNEELTAQVAELQAENEKLSSEIKEYKKNQKELLNAKTAAEDALGKKEEELAAANAQLDAALKRNEELYDDLEVAQTQVPAGKPLKEGDPKPAGVYLKHGILFIPGFGHVRKEDGPLSKAQLEALRKSFDEENWSDEKLTKEFLEVVQ